MMTPVLLTILATVPAAGHDSLLRLQKAMTGTIAAARPAVVDVTSRHGPSAPGYLPYESTGAGVIVDPCGLVLTNQHVVAGAQEIEVGIWRPGAPRYAARIVTADAGEDLALLAIVGEGPFPSMTVGSPLPLAIGEHVVAIGTPLGLPHSASSGIVSDLSARLRIGERSYSSMIQTDTTINQGNSGGPLLNLRGEMVGLVTAIFAPDGVSTGVAFAAPAQRLQAFLERALPAADLRTAAFDREPIRIGQKRPHPFSGDCTQCHRIQRKLAISMAQDMPHPFVGDCTTCHVVTDAPASAGDRGAAAQPAGLLVPSVTELSPVTARSSTPLAISAGVAAVAVGIWLWQRARAAERQR